VRDLGVWTVQLRLEAPKASAPSCIACAIPLTHPHAQSPSLTSKLPVSTTHAVTLSVESPFFPAPPFTNLPQLRPQWLPYPLAGKGRFSNFAMPEAMNGCKRVASFNDDPSTPQSKTRSTSSPPPSLRAQQETDGPLDD